MAVVVADSNANAQVEEGMRRLFQEVFAFIRKQVGPKMSDEELLKLTKKALSKMEKGVGPATWAEATPARIQALRKAANLYRAFRVVGSICELRDPELVGVPDGQGAYVQAECTCLKIVDPDGDSIFSLDIVGAEIDAIYDLRNAGGLIEFLVMPLALPIRLDRNRPDQHLGAGRQGFFVHILDVRESSSMLDFIGASAEERANAEGLLAELHERNVAPADFIFEQLVSQLHVVGLDEFTHLRDALRFAVTQSLSCGRVDHAPGRLHGMVIGPPGHGKKLVGLAARVLNPVCIELSPSKVSAAGLVGASRRTEAGWVSQPGALPRAAHGVAVLQDAHGWDGALLRKLAPVIQELTEDGCVRDSVAGGTRRPAHTALLIDLNRTAQVTAGSGAPEAGLLRIRPVLSRFDLILEIPEDANRIWNVAGKLYGSIRGSFADLDHQPWVRELRLLVALLRDRNPLVDLDPVRDTMTAVHNNLQAANSADFDITPEAGDIPTRLAITFARLVSAIARGRDADVASPSDIDVATVFLNYKLGFLRMKGTSYPTSMTGSTSPDARAEWFNRYAGREVRTQDVVNDFKEQTGQGMAERTARRRIMQLGGLRTGKGRYLLPPGDAPNTNGAA
jgi:hypothetical protein